MSILFTAPAKWPLFNHTCWESSSTINSGVFLGNVQTLFTFDVFHRVEPAQLDKLFKNWGWAVSTRFFSKISGWAGSTRFSETHQNCPKIRTMFLFSHLGWAGLTQNTFFGLSHLFWSPSGSDLWLNSKNVGGKVVFGGISFWNLTYCEWRAAAPGLRPLCCRAPELRLSVRAWPTCRKYFSKVN